MSNSKLKAWHWVVLSALTVLAGGVLTWATMVLLDAVERGSVPAWALLTAGMVLAISATALIDAWGVAVSRTLAIRREARRDTR